MKNKYVSKRLIVAILGIMIVVLGVLIVYNTNNSKVKIETTIRVADTKSTEVDMLVLKSNSEEYEYLREFSENELTQLIENTENLEEKEIATYILRGEDK